MTSLSKPLGWIACVSRCSDQVKRMHSLQLLPRALGTYRQLALCLALVTAGDGRDPATELFDFVQASPCKDLDAINSASNNVHELKRAVHELYDAVRYCRIARLTKAIKKPELALKHGKNSENQPLLNMLDDKLLPLATGIETI